MIVRDATGDDLPRLLALDRQAREAAHWHEQHYRALFAAPESNAGVESLPPPVWRICLVVESRSRQCDPTPENCSTRLSAPGVDGFLVAQTIGSEWEIENLVVDADFRRRGLASLLMRELLSRVSAAAARTPTDQSPLATPPGQTIALEVRESNQAARAFYSHWGFREVGRRKGYYHQPEEAAVLMSRHC